MGGSCTTVYTTYSIDKHYMYTATVMIEQFTNSKHTYSFTVGWSDLYKKSILDYAAVEKCLPETKLWKEKNENPLKRRSSKWKPLFEDNY